MQRKFLVGGMFAILALFSTSLSSQEFKVLDRTVQVHGFGTQGYIKTDDNNWLTMNTSSGSFKFTDVGLNLSTQITDKIRVAAQGYDRDLGELGNWHPQFDFFMADYRVKPWLGFRGGKVKTVLGLYTDTQDMDFDHIFALMPQSMYPIDMRDSSIAHLGGDIYGRAKLGHNLGAVAYTAYGGHRLDSKYSGYPYMLANVQSGVSIYVNNYGGPLFGADLRWFTPIKGLLVGESRQNEMISGSGPISIPAAHVFGAPYSEHSTKDTTDWFYGKYEKSRWQFAAEHKRYYHRSNIFNDEAWYSADIRGWYGSVGYHANKWLDLGSYYSHYKNFIDGGDLVNPGPALNFVCSGPQCQDFDKVVTGKITFPKNITLKVEGHFMAGNGIQHYPDGFYLADNPNVADNTNGLVIRSGFSF